MVPKDHLVLLARLVLLDNLVHRGLQEETGRLDLRGRLEMSDHRDHRDHRDSQDSVENLVQQGRKVNEVCAGLMVQWVLLAQAVNQAWLGVMELQANKVTEVLRVQQALRERQERTERLVRLGVPEHLARRGIREIRAT